MALDSVPSRSCRAHPALRFLTFAVGLSTLSSLRADNAPAPDDAGAGVSVNRAQPIAKIIEFSIENGNLATRTALRPTSHMRPIEVTDLPGSTSVDVRMRSRRDRPAMALYFRLNHTDRGEAEGDSTQTTLYSRPGYIEITQAAQVGDSVLTATLTQMPDGIAATTDGDDNVVLKVRRLDMQTSRVVEESTFTASTLAEMLRSHPRESADLIAPMFRTFRQEQAVMAMNLRSAWQVLADTMKADESLRPAVARLIERLDADNFRIREAAFLDLQKLGGRAALLLMQWPRGNLTPEQISRIESFLQSFASLTPDDAAQYAKDADFLLTCIAYSDDKPLRIAAAEKLAPRFQPDARGAAETPEPEKRILSISRLRKTLPPRDDDDADPQ